MNNLSKILSIGLILVGCFLLSSIVLHSGCGPKSQCKSDSDCKSGELCRIEIIGGLPRCYPQEIAPCNPTCGSGEICISGKCVRVCTPPCKAGEVCKDGQCIPTTSKEAVESELPAEDGGLSDGYTPDLPIPNDQPQPPVCIADGDCAAEQVCRNGQCVPSHPSESIAEVTTPDGGSDEQIPEQLPKDEPQVPVCNKDSDCPADQRCLNGQCTPQQGDIGDPCSSTVPCKSGLFCLDFSPTKAYCFQPCKTSDDCATNPTRKTCMYLTQAQSFCIEIVKSGEPCGLDTKRQALCDPGANLVCNEGICKTPQQVKLYDQCGIDGKVCPQNLICLIFSNVQFGYCLESCTPGGAACPNGGSCYVLGPNIGACIPQGIGDHDDECGKEQTGSSLDLSQLCKTGLECVNFGRSVCMEFWTGDCQTAGKTCPVGRTCSPVKDSQGNSYGGCFLSCPQDICAKEHLQCNTMDKTCWPKPPTGDAPFAALCSYGGSPKEICKNGLQCYHVDQSNPRGFCSQSCKTNDDCPKYTNSKGQSISAICQITTQMCVFPCGQANQLCPDGLQCIQQQLCGP